MAPHLGVDISDLQVNFTSHSCFGVGFYPRER